MEVIIETVQLSHKTLSSVDWCVLFVVLKRLESWPVKLETYFHSKVACEYALQNIVSTVLSCPGYKNGKCENSTHGKGDNMYVFLLYLNHAFDIHSINKPYVMSFSSIFELCIW